MTYYVFGGTLNLAQSIRQSYRHKSKRSLEVQGAARYMQTI